MTVELTKPVPLMKPEIKVSLLEKLRSGEYKQGRGRLCTIVDGKAEFCCLGVLTDMAVKAGIIPEGVPESVGYAQVVRYKNGVDSFNIPIREGNYLPEAVREWAGMQDEMGKRPIYVPDAASLADMNDSGYTFEEIANVIEREF